MVVLVAYKLTLQLLASVLVFKICLMSLYGKCIWNKDITHAKLSCLMSSYSFQQHQRHKKGSVEVFTLNPKCVKLGELYGETDPNTFEWSDGLIATATRKFAREHQPSSAIDTETNRPTSGSTVSNLYDYVN